MKKCHKLALFTFLIILLCVVLFHGLHKSEGPITQLIHETYSGTLICMSKDSLTINDEWGADVSQSYSFIIDDRTIYIEPGLVVGEEIIVQAEFLLGSSQPYPAVCVYRKSSEIRN